MRFSIAATLALTVAAAGALAQPAVPSFGPPIETRVPGARTGGHLDLADLNGDGRADAVLTDNIDNHLRVLTGDGAGGFGSPVITDFSTPYFYVDGAFSLADFNRDGRADVAAGVAVGASPNPGAPDIAVRFGADGGATTGEIQLNSYAAAPFPAAYIKRGLLAADFTGDGLPDILCNTTRFDTDPRLSVIPGNGAGGFGAPILSFQSQSLSTLGQLLVAGDIDGDGNLDAVSFINTGSDSRASSGAAVNINDGRGTFTYTATLSFSGKMTGAGGEARAFLSDLDGDGKADLIFFSKPGGQSGFGGIDVRLSNGNGTFRAGFFQQYVAGTQTILVTDTNADGFPDIIRFAQSGPSTILLNDGHAGFSATAPFPAVPGAPRSAAAVNVTGSSLPDVVIFTVDDPAELVRVVTVVNTTPSTCPGDFNGSGSTSVQDVFDFMIAYFAGNTRADVNHSGGSPTVQDIFDFLAAYFVGCP